MSSTKPPLTWDAVAPSVGLPPEATVVADKLMRAAQLAAELNVGADRAAMFAFDAPATPCWS